MYNKEQKPEWDIKPVSCGSFKGTISIKESTLSDDTIHTHIVYSLSDGEHTICGIGNDIDEIQTRVTNQINRFRDNND